MDITYMADANANTDTTPTLIFESMMAGIKNNADFDDKYNALESERNNNIPVNDEPLPNSLVARGDNSDIDINYKNRQNNPDKDLVYNTDALPLTEAARKDNSDIDSAFKRLIAERDAFLVQNKKRLDAELKVSPPTIIAPNISPIISPIIKVTCANRVRAALIRVINYLLCKKPPTHPKNK